jgi:DNA replication protein DnaC
MNDVSQLKPKLTRLRMSGILDNLDLRIREAEESRLGYSEFLLTLFQDEIGRRESKALTLRFKRSGLNPQKTLETFDFNFNARLPAPLVRELASCAFLERRENVFLVGPSGVGKTHLACAIGHEAVRRGIDVLFRRTTTLLKWLNSGRADATYDRKLASLADFPLLILDDFGLEDLSPAHQHDLYELICARYETASTIITSNRDLAEWPAVFDNPLIASAAVDRLVHRAIKLTIEGDSYRRDAFLKANTAEHSTLGVLGTAREGGYPDTTRPPKIECRQSS